MSTSDKLKMYADMLETALPGYLPTAPQPEAVVREAMAYSLLGGGKRIRGALVLGFYKLFCGEVTPALPYAAAVEMVHAYSLIHDDLPCMDNDDIRRGKPSCHIKFGETIALLAGDGLLNLAFETMTHPDYAAKFAPALVVRAVRCLSMNTGYGGMIGGQVIDLWQEKNQTANETQERMIAKKTGALIRASGELGCILGGADAAATAAAVTYCEKMGLAFQIRDDILDVIGDFEVFGKPIGSDAKSGKSTWVTRHGLDTSKAKVACMNTEAKEVLAALPGDTGFLAGLVDLLADREF